jgi:hypothetical protein
VTTDLRELEKLSRDLGGARSALAEAIGSCVAAIHAGPAASPAP